MEETTLLLCFLFLAHLHTGIAHDVPCHNAYTTISQVWRSTANVVKPGDKVQCDRGYIKDDTWYRFDSSVGNEMPTSNPGFRKCGTSVPIWMKGKHPTVADGQTDALACAGVPRVPPLGCGVSYPIKVVNCSSFYLYRLKEPQQCSLAYCAGMYRHN